MFEGFFRFVSGILGWYYSLTHSYGISIILLTVTVMLVITPLTLKSTKSMMQMQRMQPQLKKLQEQYKGDRERLNQEMMTFYRENNINPLSGCVPVIAQMPVFLILYQVLRGLTERAGGGGSGTGHVVGQTKIGQSFTSWELLRQPFKPRHVDAGTELYQSLIKTTKMNFLGMDLSLSPAQALKMGIITFIPFAVLMVVMLVSQVIQNRQIQGRSQNQNQNPQQQAIMKFLPFMLPVFSFGFPAGLGLYYFVQGVCRIGTQGYITKKFYGDNAPAVIEASAKDAPKGSSAANGKSVEGPPRKPAPVSKKPGTNPKSQALQKKSNGSAPGGRKSGAPRPKPDGSSDRQSGDR